MIKLKTDINLPEFPVKLSYRHQAMMMGSCFTENIGNVLRELLFPIEINPFGTLYNPFSIANSLEILMERRIFTKEDLFYANGLWNSFYHHSRYSNPDLEQCLKNINNKVDEASRCLKESNLLFLTFGTSWVFSRTEKGEGRRENGERRRENGKGRWEKEPEIVSNCHKLPASEFRRYRVSPEQIRERWIDLIDKLWRFNPDLNFVFTVSPIRHLKDGLHENQLSKASLLLAIDEITSHFGKERLFYFPSYEIVLDELRDYRFFASDMVHLTDVAIEIIREKFVSSFIKTEEMKTASEIGKLITALNHRPLHPNGDNYRHFLENQLEKINQMKSNYPFLQLEKITEEFNLKKSAF
jgi:hypothetical protein